MEYASDKFELEISKIAEKSLGVISDLYDISASGSDFKKKIRYRGCDIYIELHQEIVDLADILVNLEITIMNQLDDEVHTNFSVVYTNAHNDNGIPKGQFKEWFIDKMRAVKVTADLMTTEA